MGCPRVEDLHPAQCRNRVSTTTTARVSTACGALLDARHQTANAAAVDPALLAHLLTFQHRILRLLDPAFTVNTSSAGEPTTVDRYFTDLRFIVNLICLTWPVAQPMAVSAAQAAAIDGHVEERRHAIRHADRTHSKTQQHAIYDKPPMDSLACGSLLALADHLLNVEDLGTTVRQLGHLIGGKPSANWAAHFLHARAYCSPGPRTTFQRSWPSNGRSITCQHRPPSPSATCAAAVVLVQYAEQCTIEDAAALLCLPAEPVRTAYERASTWARYHPDGAALPQALQSLAAHLGQSPAKVDYGARRRALADWLIPPDDWQHTVEQLQRTSNTAQRQ